MLLESKFFAALLLVTASLAPQPTKGWCYLEGFTLGRGRRLYLLKAKVENDCARACEDVSPCTHWSFDRGRSYCTLRTEDPEDKMLIRRQDDALSGTEDCSLAISLTNGGYSCFSDGWTVLLAASDPMSSEEQRRSQLLHTGAALNANDCQLLCQETDAGCVVWEWDVLTKDCRLWGSEITLRRPDDLPLGYSVYTSPIDEAPDDVPDAERSDDTVEKRLETMKTVIGPRICPRSLVVESREMNEVASRSTKCTFPTAFPSETLQRAERSMIQIKHEALQTKKLTGVFVGVDSKTPTVKAITDKVASPEACQTLCKSTKSCEMFTYYIDGRSGANCVLKRAILVNEAFIHPVAITGSTTTTTALALRGMKFGYEMKNSTIITPENPGDFTVGVTHEQMFQMTSKVDALAKEACTLLGVKGYAVIDYISQAVHAVAASGATESVSPSLNYINCSKVS